MDVTAGETAPRRKADRDSDYRAEMVRAAKPQIDWARVAEQRRRQAGTAKPEAPAKPKRALAIALSPEPCGRCGVPGWKGCDHQAAYEAWTPANARSDAKRGVQGGDGKGRRRGGLNSVKI